MKSRIVISTVALFLLAGSAFGQGILGGGMIGGGGDLAKKLSPILYVDMRTANMTFPGGEATEGAKISAITSADANGYSFTQATADYQPVLRLDYFGTGMHGLEFDGDDYLECTSAAAFGTTGSMMMQVKQPTAALVVAFASHNTGTSYGTMFVPRYNTIGNRALTQIAWSTGGTINSSGDVVVDGNSHLIETYQSTAGQRIGHVMDGNELIQNAGGDTRWWGTTTGRNNMTIGCQHHSGTTHRYFFIGVIGRIGFFPAHDPYTRAMARTAMKGNLSTAYAYKQEITIPGAKVSGDGVLTAFPACIKNIGRNAYIRGADYQYRDLYVTDTTGTVQPHEVVPIHHEFCIGGWWNWFNGTAANIAQYRSDAGAAGKTFLGVVKYDKQVVVEYDHSAGTMTETEIHTASPSSIEADDHNDPAILIRESDDKLVAFYTTHNGPYLHYRLSTNALDSTAWGDSVDLDYDSSDYQVTYPQVIQLNDEENDPIYCFHRRREQGPHKDAWGYIKSNDNPLSFSEYVPVVYGKGTEDTAYLYAIFQKYDDGRIDCNITSCAPTFSLDNALYHIYYDGGSWYQLGSETALTLPVTVDDLTPVFDSAVDTVWCERFTWDESGYPILFFTRYSQPTAVTDLRRQSLWETRWSGTAWSETKVADTGTGPWAGVPSYSGSVAPDYYDHNRIFAGVEVEDVYEIQEFYRDYRGQWRHVGDVTKDSTTHNYRPISVAGYDETKLHHLVWQRFNDKEPTNAISSIRTWPCDADIYCKTDLNGTTGKTLRLRYGNKVDVDNDGTLAWDSNYQLVTHMSAPFERGPWYLGDSTGKTTPYWYGMIANQEWYFPMPVTSSGGHMFDAGLVVPGYISPSIAMGNWTGFTVEAWVQGDLSGDQSILSNLTANWATMKLRVEDTTGHVEGYFYAAENTLVTHDTEAVALTAATPTWLWTTWDGSNFVVGKNATLSSIAASYTDMDKDSYLSRLDIGAAGNSTELWKGYMGEVRISSAGRSADWMATEYTAWTDAAFYTSGGRAPWWDVTAPPTYGTELLTNTGFETAGTNGGTISGTLTATVARDASNVATINTATSHGLSNGNKVNIYLCTDTTFNATGVTVTVTDADTFTYANSGSETAETPDVGGIVETDVFSGWGETTRSGETIMGSLTADTTDVHSGSKSVKITSYSSSNAYVNQAVVASASTTYHIEFWTHGNGGTASGRYSALGYNGSTWETLLAITSTGVNGTNWTKVAFDVTTASNHSQIRLSLYSTGDVVWFDDVSLKQITTAAINNGGFEDWTVPSAAQLVANPYFTAATTNWTGLRTVLTSAAGGVDGNCLTITNDAEVGTHYATSDAITTVIGAVYKLTAWHKNGSTTGKIYVGTSQYGSQLYLGGTISDADWAKKEIYFTATTTTTYITLVNSSSVEGNTTLFDSVECNRVPSDATSWTESVAGRSLIRRADVATDVQNGSHSLAMIVDATPNKAAIQQASVLTAGVVYDYTVYLKAAEGTPVVKVGTATTNNSHTLTTSWVAYSGSFTADAATLEISCATASATVYVDSVTIRGK
ncbi:MAG: hypothetical protein WC455_26470 [Dehalococcoidia bacterium]|jgi:hypothetical protein